MSPAAKLVVVKTRLTVAESVALQRRARDEGRSISGHVAHLVRQDLRRGPGAS
jgi:hypothetical protein